MAAADSFADAARKAACGEWRKPRSKIYDYNQEYGMNYYQPMIHYIYNKEIEGPFHTPRDVYLPDRCEIVSDKYSNMRAEDVSPTDLELERFLTKAYKKRINEVNSATATAHRLRLHNSQDDTFYSKPQLLGYNLECNNDRLHYRKELAEANRGMIRRREEAERLEELKRLEREQRMNPEIRHKRWNTYGYLWDPISGTEPVPLPPEPVDEATAEKVKDVRAQFYWLYRPKGVKEYEV